MKNSFFKWLGVKSLIWQRGIMIFYVFKVLILFNSMIWIDYNISLAVGMIFDFVLPAFLIKFTVWIIDGFKKG